MAEEGVSSWSQKLANKAITAAIQMRIAKAHDSAGKPAIAKGNRVAVAFTADMVVRL
jgi:hypothetical protein